MTSIEIGHQQDLSNEFLRCRTWGHVWDEFNPINLERPAYGWRESLRCTRCTTERHRLIDRKGDVMTITYIYADGYLLTSGTKRFLRPELRVELFNRLRERLAEVGAVSANYDQNRKRA